MFEICFIVRARAQKNDGRIWALIARQSQQRLALHIEEMGQLPYAILIEDSRQGSCAQ
jgi:hypothetical protein